MTTYIYVIGHVDGPVKVGISINPSARIRELQVGCHFTLQLLHQRACRSRQEAFRRERDFHAVYAGDRLSGEWFNIDAELAIEGVSTSFEIDEYREQEEIQEWQAAQLSIWPWAGEDYGAHTNH